jgi:hypothetical protein
MTFPIDEISMDLRCDARRACNRKAVFIVSIHNINDCKTVFPNGDKGLTPAGDTVWLMCPADLAAVTKRLSVMVGEMYARQHCADVCATCGRRILGIADVMTVQNLVGAPTGTENQ